MTVWGDGREYESESRFLSFTAREFVRRLRYAITRQEHRFIWFLGAGCSVGSGIATAAELARRWLRELKYLETGSEQDLDAWAAKRFVAYDPEDPAAVYPQLFETLFYTDVDRRRELEDLMRVAEPAFGYATLAQLMTHEKWGVRANMALTTNFDDLAGDALHLYSQRRPQVLTNESLTRHTVLSHDRPTIVKLHGDAHLPVTEPGNRPRLLEQTSERLREQIVEAGLIFVGYSGRDESIVEMLEELPVGAPACGVFWINEEPPQGDLARWMENRRTIWIRHSDFDELMYFIRLEFGLGHPKVDRFERSLRRYDAQYRELSTRAGMALTETPTQDDEDQSGGGQGGGQSGGQGGGGQSGAPAIPGAPDRGDRRLGFRGTGGIGARKETEESRRERLRQSLEAFSNAIRPKRGGDAAGPEDAPEGVDQLRPDGRGSGGAAAPQNGFPTAEAAPNEARADQGPGRGPSAPRPDLSERKTKLLDLAKLELRGASKDRGDVGEDAVVTASEPPKRRRRAEAPTPTDDEKTIDAMLSKLEDASSIKISTPGESRGAGRNRPERDRLVPRPIGADEGQRDIKGYAKLFDDARSKKIERRAQFPVLWVAEAETGQRLPAEPLGPASTEDALTGDNALAAAIEATDDPAVLMARRARFLAIAARDLAAAEEAFEEAQQAAPGDVGLLRDYARFAVEQLRDADRAERLLTRALNMDLRNADTLRALAEFLVRARGDLDEAENCYRLATEVAPDDVPNRIAYARFLERRRWRRDAAEHQLRKAVEVRPQSPAALAELALLRLSAGVSVEKTAEMVSEAARLGPNDALVAFAQATLSERRGELDAAEAHYARAVALEPRLARAQLAYAAFLRHRRGDDAAAAIQLREAVGASPDDGAPLSALADFTERAQNASDEAERLHRDAVEREPYNASVRAAYAGCLGRQGAERAEEADALFQDALSLTPRDPEILRAYGAFLKEARGDADAAETYLRRAVEVDPQGVDAIHDLARFLNDVRRDAEQAEVYYREALRLAPDRADTLNQFAAFLRDTRRDLEEAERCYRQAIAQNPKDATMLSRAAQFLLAEGRADEGLKVLNDAFDAAYSMDPAVRPRWLMLELWIYRYAHDPNRREDSARAALLLIEAGARSEGWDLGPTIEQAVKAGHPNPQFLRDIAKVATDGADPSILDKYR